MEISDFVCTRISLEGLSWKKMVRTLAENRPEDLCRSETWMDVSMHKLGNTSAKSFELAIYFICDAPPHWSLGGGGG